MNIEQNPERIQKKMEEANEGEKNESETQALSPVLKEIKDMPLNFSDEEFREAALEGKNDTETSQEAFVRTVKSLIEGKEPTANTWGSMLRILDRPAMKEHPKLDLFRNAIHELAEKYGKKLN
ncbi:MAG: hypothetical protein U5L76_01345 [Patescibacteria group bacterium]|nr:hypothetical protein [Patescibacteria group bacterium]